jgi:uncharacterized membrane protein
MEQLSTNVNETQSDTQQKGKHPLRLAQSVIGGITFLIFLPPILMEMGFQRVAFFLYDALGLLCHQRADRSFYLFGNHFLYPKEEVLAKIPFDKVFTINIPQRFTCSPEFGCKIGVCARCTGIYLGLLLGLLLSEIMLQWKIPKIIPVLLVVPLILDGGIQTIAYIFAPEHGFYESTNPRRFVTGLLFGLGIGYLMASTMMKSARLAQSNV